MFKKHIKTIIFTSLITLFPMVVGLILWDKLPDMIPTHFGLNNEPDSYSSKPFAVFGMPLLMVGLQLVCTLATKLDPKTRNHNDKVFTFILYIFPATSLLMCGLMYPAALGQQLRVGLLVMLFMGVLFTAIGNYLPKCKQNYTIGIKIPWTLESTENWNKTHTATGRLWFVCGLIILATAFLENLFIFAAILVIMTVFPFVYSYTLYRKEKDEKKQ